MQTPDWDIDEGLVERCRGGDASAKRELYERHSQRVVYFFYNTVDDADRDDLVHETFLRLFDNLSRLEHGRATLAFIRGIAQNVLFEHIRARTRGRKLDPYEDSLAELRPNLSSVFAGRKEYRMILDGLRRLPLLEQILLEQVYVQGIPQVELARLEGVSASTMRSRLNAARNKLKREIEKLCASGPLLASTIDCLDNWALELRELVSPAGTA